MAYFRCSTGSASSGDGVALVVQCDANFAGSTITADNGEDTFTETCPSVSPYTVRFEGIPTGTYTISGVSQGQTFTTQFTVLDYETTLNATPEGATVLPVNDIQIWLHCANIWNKTYTTISQVLSDTSTLLALISSNNAADYMARSTNWASSVCANSTAMGYIGNNNYCASKLLANSIWATAIANSTYFESVLNKKVPTMTSDTTPSGEVSCSSLLNNNYAAWKAFNRTVTNYYDCWYSGRNPLPAWLCYQFTNAICVKKFKMINRNGQGNGAESPKDFKLQGTNDNSSWTDIATYQNTNNTDSAETTYLCANNNTPYLYYRVYITTTNSPTTEHYVSIGDLQLYGR